MLFHADGPESDVSIVGAANAEIRIPEGTFTAFAGRDVQMSESAVLARSVKMTAGRDVRIGGPDGAKARVEASDSIQMHAGQSIRISDSSQLRRLAQLDKARPRAGPSTWPAASRATEGVGSP